MVEANIVDCLGCGYCNIGCKFGKKLSMLDTVLPWAQERFPGKVRILPECYAKRIEMDGPKAKAGAVRGREGRASPLRVRARESIVVSAGAINSSLLLRRSRHPAAAWPERTWPSTWPRRSPLTSTTKLDSYDGLQISHYSRSTRRSRLRARDLVQPAGDAVALHAGVVREALPTTWPNTTRWRAPAWWSGRSPTATCAGGSSGTSDSSPASEDLESLVEWLKQLARSTSRRRDEGDASDLPLPRRSSAATTSRSWTAT